MIAKPKGTYDLFGNDAKKWQHLEKIINNLMDKYNFNYIRTPIFESSELFKRDTEQSEMVTKQTYDFTDKGGRNMTLRPEGTAGVIRAMVENKLYVDKNTKFYYIGPNYRYERPQKGRFREFYQFGVEVLGDRDYLLDFEVLDVAYSLIKDLGIDATIIVNTIGTLEERKKYNEDLTKYFSKHKENLCDDCNSRLNNNPLRILDCKVCNTKDFFKKCPKINDYLGNDSKEYFNNIVKLLDEFKIPYKIDYNLVRGLDYYSDLVFEIFAKDGPALGGGGRYNTLVKELGGPEIGGIGFACGLERLLENFKHDVSDNTDIAILSDNNIKNYGYLVLKTLRKSNYKSILDSDDRNFGKKLKQALSHDPKFLIFLKEDEYKNKMVTIKNTKTEKQEQIKLNDLISYLNKENGNA